MQAAVDSFIDGQEERLPDEATDLDLPTDEASRTRITEVASTFLQADFVEHTADEVLRGVVPYLTGDEDTFEVSISLYQPVVRTFGSTGTAPSVFEDAWLDLRLSGRLIEASTRSRLEADNDGGTTDGDVPALPPLGEQSLQELLAEDVEGAALWLDDALLELIDGALPHLVGDSERLDLRLDFTDYPALAYAFEERLKTDAETLQREGWHFTERDLHERLAGEENVSIEDIDRRLALLRPEGRTFTDDDLLNWREEQETAALAGPVEGQDDAPPDFDNLRVAIRNVRLAATWGASLLTLALVAAIAFLGGRGWNGRLLWGGRHYWSPRPSRSCSPFPCTSWPCDPCHAVS